jgi:hypothetical protein
MSDTQDRPNLTERCFTAKRQDNGEIIVTGQGTGD